MSYIKTENLKKSFMKGKSKIEVLKDVNLSYDRGMYMSIVGASGAGKSTFLHILGGLDKPTEGKVIYENDSIFEKNDEHLATFRNKVVGFVFQFHHLLPEFTALENVALPVMIARKSRDEAMQRATEILAGVGLKDRISHRPGELSGGEQQRVAIARALVNNPDVLLADEPTGNLDSKTGEEIYEILIEEKKKRQMSLIVVTHNEELSNRADIKIRLKDGIVNYE